MDTSLTPQTPAAPVTPPGATPQQVAVPTYGSTFFDPTTGKSVGQNKFDPNTGKPLQEPSTSTATPTQTPEDKKIGDLNGKLDTLGGQETDIQNQYDKASTDFQGKIAQFEQGIFPLSASQQAQIDGLRTQFNTLIKTQTDANTNFTGGTTIAQERRGLARYAPEMAQANIQKAVTDGTSKVADIESKAASAIADMQEGFDKNNYTLVKDAYDSLTSSIKQKDDTIKDMYKQVQEEIKTQQDAVKTQQDAAIKVQDDINGVLQSAIENGASKDVQEAISKATSVSDALAASGGYLQKATGELGDYLAYQRQANSVGHTPLSYDDWRNAEDARNRKNKAADSYASAYATASAQNAFSGSDKNQQKLEAQYRGILVKELSNRSGGLGLQDQKVNQAIHLRSLFDQYKDPTTGTYNIPKSQYAEIAMGLANLISGSGSVSEGDRNAIMQDTAKGDLNGAIAYVTGTPQNGTTQEVVQNLKDSIDRQGEVAEDLRDQSVQFLQGLAPTDLDPSRRESLEKNTLASYRNPTKDPNIEDENKAQDTLKKYSSVHPEKNDEITSKMDTMEKKLKRPISSAEFLQAYPQYQ